jgi:hypothetical protein
VFLAYASGQGRALVDRELYLPRSWTGDPLRLAAAGVPAGTGFATKPELLQQMIKRAAAAGMPFGWVAADEAYGDNGPLRDYLEEEGIAYVLAVSRDHLLAMPVGRRRADELAARMPRRAWQRLSCGDGAKSERRYDWALVAAGRPEITLLIRKSISRSSQLAFYLCHTPRPAPLSRLVKVAGARWAVEECFQAAKNEAGMDHYQVRRYEPWYRYVTLAMLALAFLAATRAALADGTSGLPSSANEIRRMLTILCAPARDQQHAAAGHAGAITTKNVHDKATASDNSKITKCGWSTSAQISPGVMCPDLGFGPAGYRSSLPELVPVPPWGLPRAAGLGLGPEGQGKGVWGGTSGEPWGFGEGFPRGVPRRPEGSDALTATVERRKGRSLFWVHRSWWPGVWARRSALATARRAWRAGRRPWPGRWP